MKLARLDSVVIVVSPLVSLMTDQTRSLRSRGGGGGGGGGGGVGGGWGGESCDRVFHGRCR